MTDDSWKVLISKREVAQVLDDTWCGQLILWTHGGHCTGSHSVQGSTLGSLNVWSLCGFRDPRKSAPAL